MSTQPAKLELRDGNRLWIEWSDGQRRQYTFAELRDACPCATCREKRKEPKRPDVQLTVLSPAEARPLTIQDMKPVGHYAYSISFSDGHNTGIYTIDFLRSLGQEVTGED